MIVTRLTKQNLWKRLSQFCINYFYSLELQAVEKSKEIIEANKTSSAVVEVLQVQGLTKVNSVVLTSNVISEPLLPNNVYRHLMQP